MKSETKITKYIMGKFEELDNSKKSIGGRKNINRYTRPIMSQYVENGVAILLDDIIKKNYNYLIDAQVSIGNRKIYRPDIIIYDNSNVIRGIVEVKSQLGYAGNFDVKEYSKKIVAMKEMAKKGELKIRIGDEQIYFSIANNCKDFIVILMSANDHNNRPRFEGANYFVLFSQDEDERGLWYNSLDRFLNDNVKDPHSYNKFVDFVKKI